MTALETMLDGRFTLDRRIGAGGSARIFRAHDLVTGAVVAVKILDLRSPADLARFAREAEVLAQLSHAAVVRYVAHGYSGGGEPYIVMEWLDGEDLSARLRRTPLSDAATFSVITQVARAMSWLHARGVMHRDLKPANIFLRDGRLDRVTVIDFGLARRVDADDTATSLRGVTGTPGYMAPEQVCGERGIDARADVFALGCVLFRCLAGRPPFTGEDLLSVIAKTALDDPPMLRERRPDLPESVEALVTWMLQKKPDARPSDADLLHALARCQAEVGDATPAPPTSAPRLTESELRLVSVLLIDADERRASTPGADRQTIEARLGAALGEHGVWPERLLDGTRVVALTGAGAATDQAARAARCALAARAALPDATIALATGHGLMSRSFVLGEAIDRAAWLLDRARRATGPQRALVAVDDITAGLLRDRFDVGGGAGERVLHGQRAIDGPPALLGKRAPFVGRDQEMTVLEAVFDKVVADRAAHAIILTAPAGAGKSRLGRELLSRLGARGAVFDAWSAAADPMRSSTPFGLLASALKRAAGIADGEPLELERAKIAARVARHVAEPDRARVAAFLGVMVQLPLMEDAGVEARAASADAQLMADQVRRAWLDLMAAECGAGPLVLVLEDLHWADRPTVELVDTALRLFGDRPLLALALARPDVEDVFPDLWRGRPRTKLGLGPLSLGACEALIGEALGPGTHRGTAARLWDRSSGNAFFLEELLRAEAEGRGAEVPGTVLAMIESRFSSLGADARRVLRAGSVLGFVFWRGALAALLGESFDTGARDDHVNALIAGEWIEQRTPARFNGEVELAFRHAFVREAAYALLTDEDRALGHRLAGEWLEAAGESDAMVLAEHFASGGSEARAVRWYLRAAQRALAGQDLLGAIAGATRGMELGASGEVLGELSLICAEAHGWRGELAEADRWARAAMTALPRDSFGYFAALREALKTAARTGAYDEAERLGEQIGGRWAPRPALELQVATLALAARSMLGAGRYDRARVLEDRVDEAAAELADAPHCIAEVLVTRSWRSTLTGDFAAARAQIEAAIAEHERAGDQRSACRLRVNAAHLCNLLGAHADAAATLERAGMEAERLGLHKVAVMAKHNLGSSLLHLGRIERALAVEREAIRELVEQGDRRIEGAARSCLASILKKAGDLAGAEAEARRAVELLAVAPPLLAAAMATLAEVLLAEGRVLEALDEARRAAEVLTRLRVLEEGEALVRVIFAEALAACGDRAAARAVIEVARARLMSRAAKIAGEEARACFLTRVPENARTLALARELTAGTAG